MLGVDINKSLLFYIDWLQGLSKEKHNLFAQPTLAAFFGRNSPTLTLPLDTVSLELINKFVRLIFREVKTADDSKHDGPYSPDLRDEAESARSTLFRAMANLTGENAHDAVLRLENDPLFADYPIRRTVMEMAQRDAEMPPLPIDSILDMERNGLTPLRDGDDLYKAILNLLGNIQESFFAGDVSNRRLMEIAKLEDDIQPSIQYELVLLSNNRIRYYREPKVLHKNMPDIIAAAVGAQVEVAIEIKHGDQGWTVAKLEAALADQLGEDYLKPGFRRHGVMVITNHRQRRWRHTKTGKYLDFSGLIAHLKDHAVQLVAESRRNIVLDVIGLDAAPRPNPRHIGNLADHNKSSVARKASTSPGKHLKKRKA